jgi:hypothetical protein
VQGILQILIAEPDKIFKHRGKILVRVFHLEIGFNTLGAHSGLEQKLDAGKRAAIAQKIGCVLQIISRDLSIDSEARGTHQIVLPISLRSGYNDARQIEAVNCARQCRE